MKKAEKIVRIIYIVLCILNIGSVFFGLMVLFEDTPLYDPFIGLSLLFCIPMFYMRMIYLQYILFAVLSVLSILIYIDKIKNKLVMKKILCIDILLWLIALVEVIFTEGYFNAMLWF